MTTDNDNATTGDAGASAVASPAHTPSGAAPPPTGDVVAAVLSETLTSAPTLWDQFAKAQAKFGTPVRSKTAKVKGETKNGQPYEYTYKYSSLDDLIAVTRPALNEFGIALVQNPRNDGAKVTVTTTLRFGTEEWTSDPWTLTAESPAPQKVGSALTYAKRHSMGAVLGVAAEEDDDANAAGEPKGETRQVNDPRGNRGKSSAATAPAAQSAPAQPAASAPPAQQEPPPAGSQEPPPASDKKVGKGDLAAYPGCINAKQVKRLFSIAQQHSVSNAALKSFLASGKIEHSDRIPLDRYDGIISAIQNGHVPAVKA